MTVNIALRRMSMQLAFYTDGNIPEGFVRAPEGWGAEQVEKFQRNFDTYMSGDARARSKMIWIPGGGSDPVFPKRDSLKTEEDEWWIRIICYAFSLSPQAFIRQMNRATAESAQEEALEQGLLPLMRYLEGLINRVLEVCWQVDDIEFAWDFHQDIDAQVQAEVDATYVKTGILSIDEVRERLGLDGIGVGAGVITANGFIPFPPGGSAELLDQQTADRESRQALLAAGAAAGPGNQDPAKSDEEAAQKWIAGRRAATRLAKRGWYADPDRR
jgi:hypothetical protein